MTAIPATLRLRREGVLRSRAARGDAAAFAAVYERHHQALYRYCRSILRHEEDAQDALQSTMTRAFAALRDEPRDFELRPWLFRIAHNEAISILRRRRTTDELEDQPAFGELEDRIAEREELRLLQLDLADLPERQRAALVLRELNGLSHAEIGVVLDITPATVKQSIFEARTALFSCREGREMSCQEIRRILSDGDGRVLRGRGVRAHLRSCSDCRRFREDLEQRPRALRALAPPLPMGTAATLLAQLLGGGGTAAKLLACIAIAGGGSTLAVELKNVRRPPLAAAHERAMPQPAVVKTLPVIASAPQPDPTAAPRAARRERERERARSPQRTATPRGKAEGHAKTKARGKAKGHEKPLGHPRALPPAAEMRAPAKAEHTGEAKAIGKTERSSRTRAPEKTPKALGQTRTTRTTTVGKTRQAGAPGQTKKTAEAAKDPPGQVKKDEAEAPAEERGRTVKESKSEEK